MITLTVAQIARATAGNCSDACAATEITGDVVIDSREAGPGSLFVAIEGERADGHDYLDAAAAAGAAAALISRPICAAPLPTILVADTQRALGALAREVLVQLRNDGDITVVAITGSVGKTTTKDLLAQMLTPCGEVIAPAGSFNNEWGLPLTVLRATTDTRVLVLEMGADGPGNLTYLTAIAPPDIAVVLAVGTAHLVGFGNVAGIASAKSELVQGLRRDGVAILNADDPRVTPMAHVSAGAQVRTFAREACADVSAESIQLDGAGRAAFTLAVGDARVRVQLALVGEHHVTNALAAATVALTCGLGVDEVAGRLSESGPLSPHRMQVREWGQRTLIDDAYNANPDSMRAALDALRTISGSRRAVAVLGEMAELGEIAPTAHREVGTYAADRADLIVVVGEAAVGIAQGAQEAGAQVLLVSDVQEAEELVTAELGADDVVLIKSSNAAGLAALADAFGQEPA